MDEDQEYLEIEATIATTHRLEKYDGRFRLTNDELDQLRTAVLSGAIDVTQNHDPTAPQAVALLGAEIRPTSDGEHELVVRLRYARVQWEHWAERVRDAGAPGGWSYTALRSFIQAGDPEQAVIVLAADAASFSQDEIHEAVEAIDTDAQVQGAELVEFYADAVCRVIVQVVVNQGWIQQWGPSIVSGLVLPALQGLATAGKWIRYQLSLRRDGRRIDAVVETADFEELRKALARADDLDSYWETDGEFMVVKYDPEQQVWVGADGTKLQSLSGPGTTGDGTD